MEFRADINGLRALAVISVLLFHLDLGMFSGGYVGVDVFFVISGFLMTGIISSRLDKKAFSYLSFFKSRVLRIVPALLATLISVLAFGYLFITPPEYASFSKDVVSSLFFFSNINFLQQEGYFNAVETINWILHTWSLSLEWQFYLVLPFIIIGLRKFKKGIYFKHGMISLFILSLAFSVFFTWFDPRTAFFILPTRLFEFMAGGFVYLYGFKIANVKRIQELGLLLILSSVLFFNSEMNFPGFYAVLPVLGAALVIAGNSNTVYLSNPVAQYLGRISYSLYLVHWPLYTAINKYFEINRGGDLHIGASPLNRNRPCILCCC